MTLSLDEKTRKLLTEGANLAHFASTMPDGSPHVTPVWVDYDGAHILVNTAAGRVKWRNVKRDPRVAISIVDQANPYLATAIRGRVVELTETGADAHIDKLAKKYLGQDKYPMRQPGEQRVLIKIDPEHVAGQ